MRIQGQGKVKDVGQNALATVPVLESMDAKIALIQALIPLGLGIRLTLAFTSGPRSGPSDATPCWPVFIVCQAAACC